MVVANDGLNIMTLSTNPSVFKPALVWEESLKIKDSKEMGKDILERLATKKMGG